MTKLLPIILIAMALRCCRKCVPQRIFRGTATVARMLFFCVCMMLVLAVFVGLRTRYNDTTTYTRSYELLQVKDSLFSRIEWSPAPASGLS